MEVPGPLYEVTARELEAAGRRGTVAGEVALVLAARIDSPRETGSAVAVLSREYTRVMTDALGDVPAPDPMDELLARRVRRREIP